MRQLSVYLDGVPVGSVTQTTGGAVRFAYDEEYRASPGATPLSLAMPLTEPVHGPKVTRAYLEGLLPDSQAARERWGRQFNTSPNNAFGLLAHVGRDAAGAVQILPPDEPAPDATSRTVHVEWLSDDDFADMARKLAEDADDWDPGRFGGRWSLSGAQPKMALFRDPESGRWGVPLDSTPTTHIIKPAIAGYLQHHVNEALCLRAAATAGLTAAKVDLVEVAGIRAVISHRYDRALVEGRWVRLHQEDMCQAMSVAPSMKYQNDGGPGVTKIGALLRRLAIEDRTVSAERFFKALAFNVLIGGTDAHAKNYSMVLRGPRAQVAPLYDVASAAPYPQHKRLDSAMMIGEHWKMLDVTSKDWATVGARLGIPGDQAVAWVEELRRTLPGAFESALLTLADDVQLEAKRMTGRIIDHVERRWTPDLSRNPDRVSTSPSSPMP